jgi:hypothetical protein
MVGAPIRTGFDEVVVGPWDLMNETSRMTLEELIVSGAEPAMIVESEVTIDGQKIQGQSIETLLFSEDGSIHLRNYWQAQGEMLESYAAGVL